MSANAHFWGFNLSLTLKGRNTTPLPHASKTWSVSVRFSCYSLNLYKRVQMFFLALQSSFATPPVTHLWFARNSTPEVQQGCGGDAGSTPVVFSSITASGVMSSQMYTAHPKNIVVCTSIKDRNQVQVSQTTKGVLSEAERTVDLPFSLPFSIFALFFGQDNSLLFSHRFLITRAHCRYLGWLWNSALIQSAFTLIVIPLVTYPKQQDCPSGGDTC